MIRFLSRVALVGFVAGFTSVVYAQVVPTFPPRGVQIIDTLLKDSANQALARGTDDQRRALTRKIIEQLKCEFPQAGYTWKAASQTRPPSKDAIARAVGGRLYVWDWQNGSTRQRQVQANQRAEDITGQFPIPVSCVNHLGVPLENGPTPDPGTECPRCPEPTPCPTCPPDLSADLQKAREQIATMTADRDAWKQGAEEYHARLVECLNKPQPREVCKRIVFGLFKTCHIEYGQ